ncbi:D-alanine--D-alanine ligase [Flavobacterium sp. GT3R68]|uniref:D-alanine--D-alanine ligase n=1 Tax=Flavobacterium sp. GT3R68 TaxID=2594437 RepID=UPI0026C50238
MMESKKEIYDLIPQKYYPKTDLIKTGTSFEEVVSKVSNANIQYPFIAKPDIGLRGSAVKKIANLEELQHYHTKADFDYLIQDLIPFAKEVGIFYVRFPHQQSGEITGIVAKEFLSVIGDGIATVEQLIRQNPRFELQLKSLKREYGNRLQEVVPDGEIRNLVPYGNHARGAKFIDGSSWVTPKLTDMVNEMCLAIPGFYFGRLDIMYNSLEELESGENFAIVELNGAGSEPTHIYDPKHSLFFAWKELIRHIRYMYAISIENYKNGAPFLSHKAGMEQYRMHLEQSRKIVNF